MELSRLRVFVAVAEARSFTLAAERLVMTKSAVSQQVSALERELGVQLLQRSTRHVVATQAGEAFVMDCRELLLRAEQVAERARGSRAQLSGTLRITSAADSAAMVAPLLAEYAAANPLMHVEYLPTDQLIDLAKEGIDLSLRTTTARDSSLRATGLADVTIWCVASPDYLKAHGTPQRVEDLARHEWIGFTALSSPWTVRFRCGRRTSTVRLKGRLSTSTGAGGRALAIEGVGIFAAPDFALRQDIAAGRLVRVLPQALPPPVSLYAAWPGRLEPPAKTRAFIELAKLRLRGKRA
jgi:DNA-binding transcriptional LysR family regulator